MTNAPVDTEYPEPHRYKSYGGVEWVLKPKIINVPLGLLLSALELVNIDPFPLTEAQFSMLENHLAELYDGEQAIKADIIGNQLQHAKETDHERES